MEITPKDSYLGQKWPGRLGITTHLAPRNIIAMDQEELDLIQLTDVRRKVQN